MVIKKSLFGALILIVTRKCNLNCSFCPQNSSSENLTLHKALKAANLYLKLKNIDKFHLRLFGGEPLLRFELIKKTLDNFFPHPKTTADITTNATLLDREKIDFLSKFPQLEVNINSYTFLSQSNSYYKLRLLLKLPKVTFNILFSPGFCKDNFNNFIFLLKAGFRRFNFLPVYYTCWKPEQIKNLRIELLKVQKIINSLRGFLHIKNKYVYSEIPLFNQNITVDTNGDIFSTNLILDRNFSKHRNTFLLGNISNIKGFGDLFKRGNKKVNVRKFLREHLDRNVFNSTFKVDSLLTDFVESI